MYTHRLLARRSTQEVKYDPHRICHKFLCSKTGKNLKELFFSLLFILVYKMCLFSSKKAVSKIK